MTITDVEARVAAAQPRVDAPGAGSGPRTLETRPDPRLVDLDGMPMPLSGVDRPSPAAAAAAPSIDLVV